MQADWKRPYEYLDLAYRTLNNHLDNLELIDCVSNLKRAIDHRIKKISSDYKFKRLNVFNYSKGDLDKLTQLGLAKPAMLHQIRAIRNAIEHQFSEAPNKTRCSELADFTWYFLRATDEITRSMPTDIQFCDSYIPGIDTKIWARFVWNTYTEALWSKMEFISNLQIKHVCFDQTEGYIPIDEVYISKHDRNLQNPKLDEKGISELEPDTILTIAGIYNFEDSSAHNIVQAYFNCDRGV
ncbi:hypothetical protein NBRC116494_22200 [Aurantivibrio plasticivorans]